MSKRPTIQMIAELAGVSRGTVDRVLNGRSYVKADVRERVLAAVAQTGYVSPREAHRRQLEEAFKPISLGVLLPNWEGQFRRDVLEGIERAKEELSPQGVQVLVRSCRTDLAQEAVGLLDELAEQGVSGLAVCALHDHAIEKRLSELAERGVACITFNSDLPESGRLCFVGQDIRKSGRVAAQLMSTVVGADRCILATVGNLKFDGHRQRLLGFQERLAELGYPSDRLLTAETFNDYSTTVQVVARAIRQHADLAGIYMANLSVSGCAEAIRAAGKQGQIHLICHDINDGIRQLLREGLVDFTIPQDMVRQGRAPLVLLADWLRRDRRPDPSALNSSIQILCAENI